MRSFQSLSEQEILALAISLEEEDARIYGDFAEGLKADAPATAAVLKEGLLAGTGFVCSRIRAICFQDQVYPR